MTPSSRFASLASRLPGRARWSAKRDWTGARNFALSLILLGVALVLALHGAAAFDTGHKQLGVLYHGLALTLAFYVAVKFVPGMARNTPLSWLVYQVDYKFTREGVVYLTTIFLIVIAALNTGNNLLFIMLSSLLAGILISGLVSRLVLTGIQLDFLLPDHIFAQQPILATLKLVNQKQSVPSFSLYVANDGKQNSRGILPQTVYFPYVGRGRSAAQQVELLFPRRGRYTQTAFRVSSKFPFGFLLKTRTVPTAADIVAYPPVQPTEEFYEILPLISGEMESFYKGRGHDLYSIRDYQPTDSARAVDWKASAKTQQIKVREFTREDERRVELVFDPCLPQDTTDTGWEERFERAVTLCACLAWHFYEINSQLKFRTLGYGTAFAPAGKIIYDVLYRLAFVEAERARQGELLRLLPPEPNTFKIVLTAQPRGSIPTSLWATAYIVFMQSL